MSKHKTAHTSLPEGPLIEGGTSAIAEVQGRYADAVDAELRRIASEVSPDELSALRRLRHRWMSVRHGRLQC